MLSILYKVLFRIRFSLWSNVTSFLRKVILSIQGINIGRGTKLPLSYFTWPHAVTIGSNCIIEHNTYFKVDGIGKIGKVILIEDHVFIGFGCEFNIRKKVTIGKNCLIASGCKFIDHDHGTIINQLIRNQHGPEQEIFVGNDVWLGCNVIVLKGVTIGNGAVVAAGAVVTKSIPSNEIWAGIPAKKVGMRKTILESPKYHHEQL